MTTKEINELLAKEFHQRDDRVIFAVFHQKDEDDVQVNIFGAPEQLTALVLNIIRQDETIYEAVKAAVGAELQRRVAKGVEEKLTAQATKNIKAGKYVVKPSKDKS